MWRKRESCGCEGGGCGCEEKESCGCEGGGCGCEERERVVDVKEEEVVDVREKGVNFDNCERMREGREV